jgi:nucleoside-diphosphate-sugar epimerase
MGIHVVEACRRAGIEKLVTLGTVCSYPKYTPVPFEETAIWDGYPEETNAPYGLAKKMLLVQQQANATEYGTNAIFLMPANLYGPGDDFNPATSHVIPALIRRFGAAAARGDTHVEVWGTGQASREFLYVADAALGIVLATERYSEPEPVNLGTGREVTISKLATLIARPAGTASAGTGRSPSSTRCTPFAMRSTAPDPRLRQHLLAARIRRLFATADPRSVRERLRRELSTSSRVERASTERYSGSWWEEGAHTVRRLGSLYIQMLLPFLTGFGYAMLVLRTDFAWYWLVAGGVAFVAAGPIVIRFLLTLLVEALNGGPGNGAGGRLSRPAIGSRTARRR